MIKVRRIRVSWFMNWEKVTIKKLISWENNDLAGVGFLKRYHKELSIQQPEGCSLSRAPSFKEHNVKLFFDKLKKAYDLSEIFSGTRIYNLNETNTANTPSVNVEY